MKFTYKIHHYQESEVTVTGAVLSATLRNQCILKKAVNGLSMCAAGIREHCVF